MIIERTIRTHIVMAMLVVTSGIAHADQLPAEARLLESVERTITLPPGPATRSTLLQTLARETGAKIVGAFEKDDTLDLSSRRLTISQALRVILGRQSSMVVYDKTGGPKTIALLGGSESQNAAVAGSEPGNAPPVDDALRDAASLPARAALPPYEENEGKAPTSTSADTDMHVSSSPVDEAINVLNSPEFHSLGKRLMRNGDPSDLASMVFEVFGDAAPSVLQEIATNAKAGRMRELAATALLESGAQVPSPDAVVPTTIDEVARSTMAAALLAGRGQFPPPNDGSVTTIISDGGVSMVLGEAK